MPVKASDDNPEKARRFREAALPYLDDAYTLARYLLRNAADAEDAVQECYLRAFKHFDSYRGPAMKPWLFAILRNVCRAEYARRATTPTSAIDDVPESAEQAPLWHETQETPEAQMLRRWDSDTIRRLVAALAEPFRETFVLREIQNLSYREISRSSSSRADRRRTRRRTCARRRNPYCRLPALCGGAERLSRNEQGGGGRRSALQGAA